MILNYKIRAFGRFIRYDIHQGIAKLIKWAPVIFWDRDWDHYFLFELLKKKLEMMESAFRNYGMGVNSVKDADRMRICINLINRITEENYYEMYEDAKTFKYLKEEAYRRGDKQLDRDKEYLFKIMNKHILGWWD